MALELLARYVPLSSHIYSSILKVWKSLAHGFYDGVGGFFYKPYIGAKAEGALGFAKGCGRGLTGIITEPISGNYSLDSALVSSLLLITKQVPSVYLDIRARALLKALITPFTKRLQRPYSKPNVTKASIWHEESN